LVNIPLFLFYSAGPAPPSKGFIPLLGKLSVGNLGTSDYTCAAANIGDYEKKLGLYCNYGTVRDLFQFGLAKQDNQTCTRETGVYLGEGDTWEDLQWQCNMKNGLSEPGRKALEKNFKVYCYGKEKCDLPV